MQTEWTRSIGPTASSHLDPRKHLLFVGFYTAAVVTSCTLCHEKHLRHCIDLGHEPPIVTLRRDERV